MKRYEATEEVGVEVKRFYIPLIINVTCPKCKRINEHDFGDNYLSYPILNKPETISVHCDDCDDYFNVDIKLRIAIEVDEESIKPQD